MCACVYPEYAVYCTRCECVCVVRVVEMCMYITWAWGLCYPYGSDLCSILVWKGMCMWMVSLSMWCDMYVWCVNACGAHKCAVYVCEADVWKYVVCQTSTNFMSCVVCAASTHGLCVVYCADVSIVFECGTYGISVSECVWYERGCACECSSRVCLWVCI